MRLDDLTLPTFKGVDLPNIDALTVTSAKLNSLTCAPTGLNPFAVNLSMPNVTLCPSTCKTPPSSFEPDYLKTFQQASASLNQAQRGWLAKGIRDWNSYLAKAINWIAVEAKSYPDHSVFDLRTFLHRRQLQGIQRRALWAQRSTGSRVRAWFLNLGDGLLSRVAVGLRTDSSVPRVLLAILKAAPGWATAVRFRIVLESSLPQILEQLAEVIAPNAPSRLDRPRRFPIEAGAA